MEYFLIYLLLMLDNFRSVVSGAAVLTGLSLLFTVGATVVTFMENCEEWYEASKKWSYRFLAVIVACGVVLLVTPTTKQAAIIIGGGAVVSAVTSEKGKEVAGRMGGALEYKLYEILGVEGVEEE